MELRAIIDAYFTERRVKRNSPVRMEWSLHWERNCVDLCREVNERTFTPHAYAFVVTYPKPREVFGADMATIVLSRYVIDRLLPLAERRMTKHNYNSRKGYGVRKCQNALIDMIREVSDDYTLPCYITRFDLKGCFPNIDQSKAFEMLREVIESDYRKEDKDELLWVLQRLMFAYPADHCERRSSLAKWEIIPKEKSLFCKPDGTGASIGSIIWQLSVNFYFDGIDRCLEDMGIRFVRFVDDWWLVTSSKAVLTLLPGIRKKLTALGATMHPGKFYHQECRKGVECLGVHIKPWRVHINERVVRRAVHRLGRFPPCKGRLQEFMSVANSYLGTAAACTSYKQTMKVLKAINKKWWDYIDYNPKRRTIKPKKEYNFRQQTLKSFAI